MNKYISTNTADMELPSTIVFVEDMEFYMVKKAMPGVTTSDVTVKVSGDNTLSIHNRASEFTEEQQVYLDIDVLDFADVKSIDAFLENGVLTVVIPKQFKESITEIEIPVTNGKGV